MNLNIASNEELESYRIKTASVLKIDPFMLDFIWMNDPDTGLKNRVLYAKRGAAEVLRQNLSISILSMEHYESNGWLMFTAIGKDAKGRQEIAHGAAYVDGLKADKKAHSVMTASTRALRRLTLQFVAGGILDETEVQAQSALQVAPAASLAEPAGSLAVLPPPTTAPSEAPGKDITPKSMIEYLPDVIANMESHIEKVYADGAKALADMKPAKITTLVPEPVQPERIQTTTFPPDAAKQPDIKSDTFDAGGPPNIHQNPLNQGVSLQDAVQNIPQTSDIKADTDLPKRRGRRLGSRNRVNIQSPSQQTEIPVGQIDAQGKITPIDAVAEHEKGSMTIAKIAEAVLPQAHTEYHVPLPPHVGTTVVIVPDPALQNVMQPVKVDMVPAVVPALPKEKQEEYRTRLSKYYNDILPKGGMSSSEGIGGPTMKTRKFAAIHTGVADTKLMTEQHWNDLFEFLDANATNPKFLVEYINKALGVA